MCRTSSFQGTFATAFKGSREAGSCRGVEGSAAGGTSRNHCGRPAAAARCKSAGPALQRAVGVYSAGAGGSSSSKCTKGWSSSSRSRGYAACIHGHKSSSRKDDGSYSSTGIDGGSRGVSQVNPWVYAPPAGPGPGAYDVVRLRDGSLAAGVAPAGGTGPSYTWGKADKMVRWVTAGVTCLKHFHSVG